ncbi:DUF5694 domain-containing protein [Clostridium sp. UBA871]|uniref:DUF5694 domain-containing protein n=1 Tax=Clostridium sp. UBA871 TaxID=1946380 RepID=UPI00321771BD
MEKKAKILILGTYHFGKGGEHLIKTEYEDITTAKKQKEIKVVIEKLMQFKPNKIAVEANRGKNEELNKAYSEYCVNKYNSSDKTIGHRNEIVQLGFRLGQILKHNKIYSIDYPVDLPEQVFEYAEKNCPKFYEKFMNEIKECNISENEIMKNSTVIEILKHLNDPTRIAKEHSDLYLDMAQIGAGGKYYGVDMLTEWYRRNLYIFGNLQDIVESGDRVLVIYGAGHCKILQDFVSEYNDFELVDTLEYL